MASYKCLKCSYKCKLFNDMTRHLTKNTTCPKCLDGYNYTDEELLKLSLIPYYNEKQDVDINLLKNKNKNTISKNKLFEIINDIEKKKLRQCPLCSKSFNKKYNLKYHIILECTNIDFNLKDIDEINKNLNNTTNIDNNLTNIINIDNNSTNITNINDNSTNITNVNNNNSNNITNNYNINNINVTNHIHINFNVPVSFDDEWDVSHLSEDEKSNLMLSMYKYTKTLESLLKNKNNHNVIIDKESNSGIVYNKNNIETLSLEEICDKSVDKLNHHLNKFVDEAYNNKYCIYPDYIKHSKKVIRIKHGNYKNNKKDKELVNEMLVEKYNDVKDETLENFNKINEFKKNKIKF
jgi:hypothetical protein